MNIRCAFCQTPYAIGHAETLAALQHLQAENLTHYDAHCPRCRRATPIQRQKLEMSIPNWQDALKEAVKEAEAHPAPASESKPEPAPVAQTESKPAPKSRTHAKAKSVAKKTAPAKSAAEKSPSKSSTKKTTKKSK